MKREYMGLPEVVLPDGRTLKPGRAKKERVYVLPEHGLAICLVNKVSSKSILRAVLTSLGMPWEARGINRATDYWQAVEDDLNLPAVGMIREPVDRFLSAYVMRQSIGFPKRWNVATVDDCILHVRMMYRGSPPIAHDVHFAYQAPALALVQTPGRFDRIQEWWAEVRAMSAVPLPDLPHEERSEKPALTEAQVAALHEIYRDDLELYAEST